MLATEEKVAEDGSINNWNCRLAAKKVEPACQLDFKMQLTAAQGSTAQEKTWQFTQGKQACKLGRCDSDIQSEISDSLTDSIFFLIF